ncbi:hypothetical protein QWJ17_00090 [Betaproteobacteria bacterium LSUCC0117]|nr:hypothetical protein [Betaproteobacteria bacterium LSUCC0117]
MTDTPAEANEIRLFAVVLTIAENLRLLVIVPTVAGLVALGYSSLHPKTYESIAFLNVTEQPAAAVTLVTAAAVLDPVAERLGLTKVIGKDAARAALLGRVSASLGNKDQMIKLVVTGENGDQAHDLAEMVLSELINVSAPKGRELEELEMDLAQALLLYDANQRVIEASSGVMQQANKLTLQNLNLQGYSDLIDTQMVLSTEIREYRKSLRGRVNHENIAQSPTRPSTHTSSSRLRISGLATAYTSLVLLIFVFIRKALTDVMVGSQREQVLNIKSVLRRKLGLGK